MFVMFVNSFYNKVFFNFFNDGHKRVNSHKRRFCKLTKITAKITKDPLHLIS